jgi:hypothetical protein
MEKTKSTYDNYMKIYKNSIKEGEREKFWSEEAKEIHWMKPFTEGKELDNSNVPFYKWFKDGETNICYNCLDKHIEAGQGENYALIWESAYLKTSLKYT